MPSPEDPTAEPVASTPEHVKPVAWMGVDPPDREIPEGPRSRSGALGVLVRIVRPVVRYPRVSIEGFLTLASIGLGLYFLPTAGAAVPPPQAAIQSLVLSRTANVPTYVLDRSADTQGPDNEIIVGMDVAATSKPVNWTLYIVYRDEDHIVDRNGTSDVNFGAVLSSHDLGLPGYQALQVTGTIKPGSRSYTEYKPGFLQTVSQNGLLSGGSAEPKDVSKVDFVLSGPIPITVVSGASMAVSLPGITPFSGDTPKGAQPAPFHAEMLYDAGLYQNQTGGPTIEAGTTWDWSTNNAIFQATTATGLHNGEARTEENDLFLAAVFFGLSAAAGAAFAVELVEAVQEHSREKRERAAAVPPPGATPPVD